MAGRSPAPRTGTNRIRSLKVRYNQVFGYYIEISAANLGAVPADYTRKQTLANAERFVTPELKEMESKILGAQERSRQLEYELFSICARRRFSSARDPGHCAGAARDRRVARLGRFGAGTRLCPARENENGLLLLEEARHPVLEQLPANEKFVPNDVRLDVETETADYSHRTQHGGQEHLHPAGRRAQRCWPIAAVSSRPAARRWACSTAFSPALAPAMISDAAKAPSWWK